MDWFSNIWQWIIGNKDSIVTFFSTIDLGALIAALWTIYKQSKQIKRNTSSTESLNATLKNNKTLLDEVRNLKAEAASVKEENLKLEKQISELKQIEELFLNKINAMLDVQSIVYATIKDEGTRMAVNNILTNAKYSESSTKAKLIEELQKLKLAITEQAKASEEQIVEVVTKAESILENTKTDIEETVTRY